MRKSSLLIVGLLAFAALAIVPSFASNGMEPISVSPSNLYIPFLLIPFACLVYIFRGLGDNTNPLWGNVLASGTGLVVCGIVSFWFLGGGIMANPVLLENTTYGVFMGGSGNGTAGPPGSAATIDVNYTAEGSPASVTNVGTTSAALLDFVLPPGTAGPAGANGTAATIAVNNTETLLPGLPATVTNIGTVNAAIFDFGIPAGNDGAPGAPGAPGANGADGADATVAINYTETLASGNPATVTNIGTPSNVVLDFGIPSGADGAPGAPGTPGTNGTAATIVVNYTETGAPGTSASVTNIGTAMAAIFDFVIPSGATGATGANGTPGINGTNATVAVNYTATLPVGSSATVANVGTASDALLDFGIPTGATGATGPQGDKGDTGGSGGKALYFRHDGSPDVGGYERLVTTPAGSAEDDETVIVKNGLGQVLVDSYVTDTGYPASTQIPAGLWTFRTFHYVSSASGNTNAVFKVYNRTSGGTETLLFTATSADINALTTTQIDTAYAITSAYTTALTDRIVVKVYGQSDHSSNVDFHFVYEGTNHTSMIQTSFESAPATSLSFSVVAGETIKKGQAVYISGASGGNPQVKLADNTATTTSRVVGLMEANTVFGALGTVRRSGALTSVDTQATSVDVNPNGETWAAGDLLFATTNGGLTNVRPTSGRSVKAAYSLAGSSAADSLLVYPMENPVWTTAAANENITLRLGDSAGATYISIKDYTNTEIGYINSDGYGSFKGMTLGGNLVHNVTDPVDPQDAATKNYVDTHSGTDNDTPYLFLNGTRIMTGSFNAGAFNISNVSDPVSAQDAATKNYVDTVNASLSPGAITSTSPVTLTVLRYAIGGPLGISLQNNLGLTINDINATISDSDYKIPTSGAVVDYVAAHSDDDTMYPFLNGTRMYTGAIDMGANQINNVSRLSMSVGDIRKSGDTGTLSLAGGDGAGANLPAQIDLQSSGIANGNIIFYTPNAAFGTEEIFRLIAGIPTGYIDANSHTISNVTDPTDAQDAATKNYVDTHSGADDDTMYLFRNGTRSATGRLTFETSSGYSFINRSVSSDYFSIFGGTSSTDGSRISLYGGTSPTTPGTLQFYVTDAADTATKFMEIAGDTDIPYLNLTNHGVYGVGTYISSGVNNSYLMVRSATAGYSPSMIIYGQDYTGATDAGDIGFFVTNAAKNNFVEAARFQGNTDTPYLSMTSHRISNVTDPSAPQDVATKNYIDSLGVGDLSQFLFLNGTRPMTGALTTTGVTLTSTYVMKSNSTGVLQLNGGNNSMPGAFINLIGYEYPSAGAGSMYFYVPNATGKAWHNPLTFAGKTDTPTASFAVPVYFNSNALYDVGTVVVSSITAMVRNVDNSYINIYGGAGTGAAITINGPSSVYIPGAINFWTTNAADVTAAVATFTGDTNTPALDMLNHPVVNVDYLTLSTASGVIKRSVDNDLASLYGGTTTAGQAAIVQVYGADHATLPGRILFYVPNTALNSHVLAAQFVSGDNPYLYMQSNRIASVGNATTEGDALNYHAWTAWTPTLSWTGVAPTGCGLVSRFYPVGKTVYYSFYVGCTDANTATTVTATLPVTPKNNGKYVSVSAMRLVGSTATSPPSYILANGADNLLHITGFTVTDGSAVYIASDGFYEVT